MPEALDRRLAAVMFTDMVGYTAVYSDETPGQGFVDQAKAALSAAAVTRATEAGSRLTIAEALALGTP